MQPASMTACGPSSLDWETPCAGTHAADALAVADQTMRRVDVNVRILVERLGAMGYRFGPPVGAGGRLLAPLPA